MGILLSLNDSYPSVLYDTMKSGLFQLDEKPERYPECPPLAKMDISAWTAGRCELLTDTTPISCSLTA